MVKFPMNVKVEDVVKYFVGEVSPEDFKRTNSGYILFGRTIPGNIVDGGITTIARAVQAVAKEVVLEEIPAAIKYACIEGINDNVKESMLVTAIKNRWYDTVNINNLELSKFMSGFQVELEIIKCSYLKCKLTFVDRSIMLPVISLDGNIGHKYNKLIMDSICNLLPDSDLSFEKEIIAKIIKCIQGEVMFREELAGKPLVGSDAKVVSIEGNVITLSSEDTGEFTARFDKFIFSDVVQSICNSIVLLDKNLSNVTFDIDIDVDIDSAPTEFVQSPGVAFITNDIPAKVVENSGEMSVVI